MNKKNILIVDDSQFDRDLLSKAISRNLNLNVIEAQSGEQCLEILSKNSIDVILLDILMPGMAGTEVLFKIRENHNPIHLPIIMTSAKADASDVIGCLHTGANDYVTKPINFDVLTSRIQTQIKISQLSKEIAQLKEKVALDALITTYNHEINNKLAIAIGCLNSDEIKAIKKYSTLESSLWGIAEIIKKIRDITKKEEPEYSKYTESSKMIKIHKD